LANKQKPKIELQIGVKEKLEKVALSISSGYGGNDKQIFRRHYLAGTLATHGTLEDFGTAAPMYIWVQ
jgi:hypothetical protein